MKKNTILSIILISFLLISYTNAFKSNIEEYKLLQNNNFKNFLSLIVFPENINNKWWTWMNKNGFKEISSQREWLRFIMKWISNSDNNSIELWIKAIEYWFEYQNKDGSFINTLWLDFDDPDAIEANSFFMQSVAHSYLLVKNSKYSSKYMNRLDKLRPKIQKSIELLKSQKIILYKKAKNAPNRLLFNALTFKLNGIILKNTELEKLWDEFLKENLKMQLDDWTFYEYGGYDSSYQSVNLLKLQIYLLYSTNSILKNTIETALIKWMDWQKSRINNNWEVSIEWNARTWSCQEKKFWKCKLVNYNEVVLSFLYYTNIFNDKESEILSNKIIEYIKNLNEDNLSNEEKLKNKLELFYKKLDEINIDSYKKIIILLRLEDRINDLLNKKISKEFKSHLVYIKKVNKKMLKKYIKK